MKTFCTSRLFLFASLSSIIVMLLLNGCRKDAITDSIFVQYGKVEIWTEKPTASKPAVIRGKINVRIINRTERSLNVGAVEGSFINPQTKTAIARFRPIIPEAYGTMSTVPLLPKQTKEYLIETPPDLEGFDVSAVPQVIVSLSFTTTDGYRTDVTSAEVPVLKK